MYITINNINKEVVLQNPIDNRDESKKVSLVCAYIEVGFYNVKKQEKLTLVYQDHETKDSNTRSWFLQHKIPC